jgi:hypothetical protein
MSYDAMFDRRALLAVGGAAAAVAALGAPALGDLDGADIVILAEEAAAAGSSLPAARVVLALKREDDLVRFWSREVAPRLVPGVSVAGATLWSDHLVLRGLAAEAGLKPRGAVRASAGALVAWRFT